NQYVLNMQDVFKVQDVTRVQDAIKLQEEYSTLAQHLQTNIPTLHDALSASVSLRSTNDWKRVQRDCRGLINWVDKQKARSDTERIVGKSQELKAIIEQEKAPSGDGTVPLVTDLGALLDELETASTNYLASVDYVGQWILVRSDYAQNGLSRAADQEQQLLR